MRGRIIIEGNAIYEVDDDCLRGRRMRERENAGGTNAENGNGRMSEQYPPGRQPSREGSTPQIRHSSARIEDIATRKALRIRRPS